MITGKLSFLKSETLQSRRDQRKARVPISIKLHVKMLSLWDVSLMQQPYFSFCEKCFPDSWSMRRTQKLSQQSQSQNEWSIEELNCRRNWSRKEGSWHWRDLNHSVLVITAEHVHLVTGSQLDLSARNQSFLRSPLPRKSWWFNSLLEKIDFWPCCYTDFLKSLAY